MFLGRKKEKEVKDLLNLHLEKVEKCLNSMVETIKAYFEGKIEEAKRLSYQTHQIESEADTKRREIIEHLYQGAFLPIYRESLAHFVAMQDKIADRAESCSDFVLCERVEVPAEYREGLSRMLTHSYACFAPYKEGVAHLFGDFSVLREKIKEVNKIEAGVDDDDWNLAHSVFMSKLPLSNKIHLRTLIWHIGSIADVIEDAADVLEILVVQKRF